MTDHRGEKGQHWSIGLSLPAAPFSRGPCLAVSRLPGTPPATNAVPVFLLFRPGPLRCVQHTGEMDEDGGDKVPPGIDFLLVTKKVQEAVHGGRGPLTGLFLSVSRIPGAGTPPVTTAIPVFSLFRQGPLRCVQHTGEMDEDGGDKVPPGIDFLLVTKKVQEAVRDGRGPLTGLFLAVSRLPETPRATTAVPVFLLCRQGPLRCVQHTGEMDEHGGPPGINFLIAKKVQEAVFIGRGPLTGLRLGVLAAQGVQEVLFVDGELGFLPARRSVHIVVAQGNHTSRAGVGVHGHGCNIMAISLRPRALYTPVHGAFGLRSTNNLFPHPVSSRIEQGKIDELRQLLHDLGCRPQFHAVFDACIVAVNIAPVWRHNSYRAYLGAPLQQNVPNTCALAATTKCVEIAHRWVYETAHGENTFPCIAAAPRKLRSICRRKEIWDPKNGAVAGRVLDKIRDEGGVRTTNAPAPAPAFLPLGAWEFHSSELGGGLTQDHIADLLDAEGPFVGNIWVCPWYDLFDSDVDDDMVYRSGCAGSCGLDMHVHVLDNHSTTGPKRWVHSQEIEEAYTLEVPLMEPIDPSVVYPSRGVLAD